MMKVTYNTVSLDYFTPIQYTDNDMHTTYGEFMCLICVNNITLILYH